MDWLESLPNNPLGASFVLLLHYLPLLAIAIAVGCGIGFLIYPRRVLMKWIFRSWVAGGIALLIMLPLLFFFRRPEIGYLGMILSYGLFWGGNRLFRMAHPEL
jgi:hypothetical protein